jgi:hypothetical protein
MALSAALAWCCTLGIAYPRLGINEVPRRILEQARDQPVVFYHGPQPGLLPALLGRSLIHVDDRWRLPEPLTGTCSTFLLFAQEPEAAQAAQGLARLGMSATELARFGVLSARVKWGRMGREGLTGDEVLSAFLGRDLEPIKPRVVMLQARGSRCPDG